MRAGALVTLQPDDRSPPRRFAPLPESPAKVNCRSKDHDLVGFPRMGIGKIAKPDLATTPPPSTGDVIDDQSRQGRTENGSSKNGDFPGCSGGIFGQASHGTDADLRAELGRVRFRSPRMVETAGVVKLLLFDARWRSSRRRPPGPAVLGRPPLVGRADRLPEGSSCGRYCSR